MNKLHSKIPAMIAMAISSVSFVFLLLSLFCTLAQGSIQTIFGLSVLIGAVGLLISLLSSVFYLIDAFLSLHKARKKIDPVFNTFLGILLLVSIPILVVSTGMGRILTDAAAGNGLPLAFWIIGYLAIFVLEIISIARHKKVVAKS